MCREGHKLYDYEPNHRYTIRSDPYYGIIAGQSLDAQWLISGEPQGMLLIKFDLSGKLIETSILEDEQPKQRQDQLERWKAGVGFMDKPINICKFYLKDYQIGVAALTNCMQEAVDAPDHFDPVELEMIREEIDRWLETGQFVLDWGNDYYMNKNGEVVCS